MSTGRNILRRQQALHDFLMMGPNRSVHKLWERYVEERRNGEDVPTTNNELIYRWAKEDDWYAEAARFDRQRQEDERKQLEQVRALAQSNLNTLSNLAVETLAELVQCAKDEVRLRAATEILDRIGVVRVSVTEAAKKRNSGDSGTVENLQIKVPSADAPEEEWQKFLHDMLQAERGG